MSNNLPATIEAKKKQLAAQVGDERVIKQLAAALPAHITPQRYARLVLSALNRNPKLAECKPESFLFSMMRCAEFGLLPDGRQGALVPFGGEVQFIPMYQGLIDCACRSGKVQSIQPHSVYALDAFEYEEGLTPRFYHKPHLESHPGELRGVYAVAHMSDGSKVARFMPLWRVDAHRDRSPAWKLYVKHKVSCPWVTDYEAMAWKTVIRELCKFIPQSAELSELLTADAEQYDNEPIGGKAANFDIPTHEDNPDEKKSLPLKKPQPEPGMETEGTVAYDQATGEIIETKQPETEAPVAKEELPPVDAYEGAAIPETQTQKRGRPPKESQPPLVPSKFILCPGPREKSMGRQVSKSVCDEMCQHVLSCAARKAAG